jgi:hypothetical protein
MMKGVNHEFKNEGGPRPRSNQVLAAICAGWISVWSAPAADPGSKPALPLKAAIFVENRAGAALNDKVPVLEDFLSSRVTEKGLSVISREVVANALKTYANAEIAVSSAKATTVKAAGPGGATGAAVVTTGAGEAQVSATPPVNKLDQLLSDNSSTLRLAQNLGADYLLIASIASLGSEKKSFRDGTLETVNLTHTLRVSYKLLEGVQGGSLIGDTVKATKTMRFTENSSTEDSDIVNGLLDDAATQVAANVERKIASVPKPPTAPGLVEITVACGMQDLAQLPVSIPDIRVADDGTITVTTNRLSIQVVDATVEINGTAIGSAPGKFKVPPGLNKMKISREGFKDWERTVNFSEGQKFNVALQMSEAGYARWKDNTTFLLSLETGKKLTDAAVKAIEGFAQLLRQSGYRVDTRTDIKGDVKADIKTAGKSLFDGATINPSIKSLF